MLRGRSRAARTPEAALAVPTPAFDRIPVLGATSTGSTTLSAFHRSLVTLGVGHYNLVRLSSVVPPGVRVEPAGAYEVGGTWGDRLYCVYAEQRTCVPGEEAWAGVGWVQRRDGGGGFLVEHEGGSEGFVTDAIRTSLGDMTGGDDAFTEPDFVLSGGHCHGEPICALVIGVFQTAPWVPLD